MVFIKPKAKPNLTDGVVFPVSKIIWGCGTGIRKTVKMVAFIHTHTTVSYHGQEMTMQSAMLLIEGIKPY